MHQVKAGLCAVLLALALGKSAQGAAFVRAEGSKILDPAGRELVLKGVGLGNWFLPEGYMWKFGSQGDRPRKIEAVIEKALGPAEAAAFWKSFRDNYVTESDIRRIAELGFNSVRPALKARDFLTEANPPQFLEEGFQRLDSLIGWCRKYHVYVILDLHAAPGGQTGKNIDDSARDSPDLFRIRAYQDQCEAIWLRLVSRYKDEPVVAGYDLLNEPLPAESKAYNHLLEPFYKRLTASIRKVDPAHMIILEGANWANDWSVFGRPWTPNLCYQFHKYWNEPDRESVRPYQEFQQKYGVPVWVGEFGESKVGNHWYFAVTRLFDDLGWGWSFWPWKKLDADSSPYSIRLPQGWEKIQAISNGKPGPSREEARKILGEFLQNLRLENCRENPQVVAALFHRVPARIEGEDYGFLGPERSWHLNDPRHRSTLYRRGLGPEIVPLDGPASAGFNVGWIEKGEWLQYELECEQDGLYDFSFRMASDGGGRSFHVEAAGKDLSGPVSCPNTGGWDRWAMVSAKGLPLKKGRISLRLVFDSGGTNLDYFSAALAGGQAPERPENLQMRKGAVGKLPGRVEAEDFGVLGEGRSYHDADPGNQGGTLRLADGVDIQAIQTSGGHGVELGVGEYLIYELQSLANQKLRVNLRAKAQNPTALSVYLDGKPVGRPALLGKDWGERQAGNLDMTTGKHLVVVKAASPAALDWIELIP